MKQTICLAVLLLAASTASAKDPVAAKVNGKNIRRSAVTKFLVDLRGNEALETLINRKLIKQEAQRLKLKADAKIVNDRVQAIKESLPEGTSFEERLKATGLTVKKLKSNISFELLRDALVVSMARVSISSGEVRGAFEANKDKLGVSEAVRLHHILVRTQQEAEDLLIALKAGADFGKLAAAKSLDTGSRERGGDLGFIARGMLRPEIEKAVFSLKTGEVSAVVKSTQGFHLFLGGETRKAEEAQFENVAADLYRTLRRRKIQAATPRVLTALRKKAEIKRFPLR